MVAYGGAGPLHAGLIQRELDLARVLVPPHPGLFSASGLVAADLRIDDAWTILAPHDPSRFGDVLDWYRETSRALIGQLREDGIPRSRTRLIGSIDCRYRGQGYELTVPLPSLTETGLRKVRGAFDELHRSVYGHANSQEPVELVALRLSAFGVTPRVDAPPVPRGRHEPPADARIGRRPIILPTGRRPVRADLYRREGLRAGNRIAGPAIIEQMDSTTLVLGGQVARVDGTGNLWIEDGR
jgi:N-methylhydantoinase A